MTDLNFAQRFFLREETLSFLKKHWGQIASVAGPLVAFLLPSLHAYVSANPKTALGVVIAALLTMYNVPSPWQPKNNA